MLYTRVDRNNLKYLWKISLLNITRRIQTSFFKGIGNFSICVSHFKTLPFLFVYFSRQSWEIVITWHAMAKGITYYSWSGLWAVAVLATSCLIVGVCPRRTLTAMSNNPHVLLRYHSMSSIHHHFFVTWDKILWLCQVSNGTPHTTSITDTFLLFCCRRQDLMTLYRQGIWDATMPICSPPLTGSPTISRHDRIT